ncbi:MAG: type II toxin-antitoxin system PemK/MazF family toxin [Verrucomicrobia bacterium]|nr:type II toxin-antitoxin system PemK/MazF family toxin [Verrucomicrobiota bacterium]
MSTREVRRGELWIVDWSPGRGSEQSGRRPALVIQTDAANTNPRYPNTIVLTISTKGLPITTHVKLEPDAANGLRETSFVKCEQVMTISKERLETRLGRIQPEQMRRVEAALRAALSL